MTSSQLTQRAFRRALRDFVGLHFTSQKQGFAEAAGLLNVTEKTIRNWFNGTTTPPPKRAKEYTEKLKNYKPRPAKPKHWIAGLAQILQATVSSFEILDFLKGLHSIAESMNEATLKREIIAMAKDFSEVSSGGSIRMHLFMEVFSHKITTGYVVDLFPSEDNVLLFVYELSAITYLRAFYVFLAVMDENGLLDVLTRLTQLASRDSVGKGVVDFGKKIIEYLSSVLA